MANNLIIVDNILPVGGAAKQKQSQLNPQEFRGIAQYATVSDIFLLFGGSDFGKITFAKWYHDIIPKEKPLKLCPSSFTTWGLWCILRQIVVRSGAKWVVWVGFP